MSELTDAVDALAMSLGYVCMIGPALHQAAAEKGRGDEGWGHADARVGRHLMRAVNSLASPDPFDFMACDSCRSFLTSDLMASVMPDLLIEKVNA